MKLVSLALLVCAVAMAQADEPREYDLNKAPELFETFIKDYDRHYKDAAERQEHYDAFYKSLQSINESNKNNPSATFGINKFADYTAAERKNMFGFNTGKP